MLPKTHELDAVLVSDCELKAAFERTGLSRLGYSFKTATECELLKRCLLRMVLNAQKSAVPKVQVSSKKVVTLTLPESQLWWKKYY